MHEHRQFAGNGDTGAFGSLFLSQGFAPCFKCTVAFEAGEHTVGGFVERSPQHVVAAFRDMAHSVDLT